MIKFTNSLYQFIINVSTYTVLSFAYSEFALELNKLFKLPIGCIKIDVLRKDETIKPPTPILKQPIKQIEEANIEEEQIKEEEEYQEETNEIAESNPELTKQIDKQIETDNTVPLNIPPKYVEAAQQIDQPIATGQSTLPPMPALVGHALLGDKEKPIVQNSDNGFNFQNILLGFGGLLIGMKY